MDIEYAKEEETSWWHICWLGSMEMVKITKNVHIKEKMGTYTSGKVIGPERQTKNEMVESSLRLLTKCVVRHQLW